jgi:hypothetical protein
MEAKQNPLCRKGLHRMTGYNVVTRHDGRRRCRICWAETRKRLRSEQKASKALGDATPIKDLSLPMLAERIEALQAALASIEKARETAHAAEVRQQIKFDRARRKTERAQKDFEAVTRLLQECNELYKYKAGEENF